jgi:Protein of unknown function (DUF2934)
VVGVPGAEFALTVEVEPRTEPATDRRVSLWRQAIGDPVLATRDEIAARAHDIYLKRGGMDGSDLDDWLQAERDLLSSDHRAPNVTFGASSAF